MHPYSSPIQADLRYLPPATVINAGHDPLCDHAAYYAFKLRESGVPATNTTYRNSVHGFFNSLSIEANEAMIEACISLQFSFESHRHALLQLNFDLMSFIEQIKDKHSVLSMSSLPPESFEALSNVISSSSATFPLSDLAISCGIEFEESMTSLSVLQTLSDQSFPLHRFLSACYLNNRLDIVSFVRENLSSIFDPPPASSSSSSSSASSSLDSDVVQEASSTAIQETIPEM